MANILLTGANGQLGTEIQLWHENDPVEGRNNLFVSDIDYLDITNFAKAAGVVAMERANVIINCAGFTAVDKAETDEETARRYNAVGPEVLARVAKAYKATLIHISTDYVFGGRKTTPYKEEDKASPLSVYGRTKLAGEQAILASGCRSIIIRTSWLYSRFGNNFVKTMMNLGAQKDEISVVDDQIGTPTYAADLADFIMRKALPAAIMHEMIPGRIYNYSNMGQTSWAGFATEIMHQAGLNCRVNPVPTTEYQTPARRPKYSVLDKTKTQTDFDVKIPTWKESLAKCVKMLK